MKEKAILWIFTIINLTLLIYGITTNPYITTPVFFALILQLLVITYLKIRKILKIERLNRFTYDRIDALLSIHQLLKFRHPLPVMGSWAISSDYAYLFIQHIFQNSKGDVLDVGSGITTLLAGYALEKRGEGKVISLEHDKSYYNEMQRLIRLHELEHVVDLYYCPLINHTLNGKKWLWYDVSAVKNLANVNLISVDGPPESTQSLARYPMAPVILTQVGSNPTILLDDGARTGEKNIAKKWASEYNLSAKYLKIAKGLFIFKKNEVG